jgi:hypothetical protein
LAVPQFKGAPGVSPQFSHGIAFPEAPEFSFQPASNLQGAAWNRQLVTQAKSQQQVLQKNAQAKKLYLSVDSNSNTELAQLAQNDTKAWEIEVFQSTGAEFFVSKCKKYIVVHGVGGNYDKLGNQMKYIKNYAKTIGAEIIQIDTIVKAHLAPDKIRTNCCVSTDDSTVILSSELWNKAEESGKIPSRILTYDSKYDGVSFEEILKTMHDQSRAEIIMKVNGLSDLSCDELSLIDITAEGHKKMSPVSVKQLISYHLSLNIIPEEGYFAFLIRDTVTKMEELYLPAKSPIQIAMFNTPETGSKEPLPGVLIENSLKQLDASYIIGMGICENISEPLAKQMLQNELASVHYQGYATATQAGQNFANLEKEQARGEVTGLPSFQPSNSTISPEPSTPQFASHLEQNRQMVLKQTSLAKEEALTVSAKVKIGDCTKSSKHQLRQVSDRPDHEIFKNKFRRVHGKSFKAKKLKSHPI